MSFKNAVKILLSKFGLVWAVLLFLLVLIALMACLSVSFIIPIINSLRDAGVGDMITKLFSSIVEGGWDPSGWMEQIRDVMTLSTTTITGNVAARVSTIFLAIIFIFAYRFFVGLYELPLISVLEASMSNNARIGFMGSFISRLGISCRFTLCKMIYTIAYDIILYAILYAAFGLFSVPGLGILAPFIIMMLFILLNAFRYSVISMWAPAVIVGKMPIFAAFGFSVVRGFKNFYSVFSSFLVAWILIVALNLLLGIFTFGAGLLLTVPVSMLFLSILDMTLYYGKNSKRYYVDSAVFTPPIYVAAEKADSENSDDN